MTSVLLLTFHLRSCSGWLIAGCVAGTDPNVLMSESHTLTHVYGLPPHTRFVFSNHCAPPRFEAILSATNEGRQMILLFLRRVSIEHSKEETLSWRRWWSHPTYSARIDEGRALMFTAWRTRMQTTGPKDRFDDTSVAPGGVCHRFDTFLFPRDKWLEFRALGKGVLSLERRLVTSCSNGVCSASFSYFRWREKILDRKFEDLLLRAAS